MRKLLLCSCLIAFPLAAHATFQKADTASTHIFFNSATNTNSFTGNVAPNNTGEPINFSSQGKVDAANGYANIKPTNATQAGNGDFTSLVITPVIQDWSAFTFRGQFGSLSPTTNLTLMVTDQIGATQTFTYTGLAGPNADFGDIGISSIDNERIASLTITAGPGDNFKELKQFDVTQSGTQPNCPGCVPTPVTTTTPEPISIALLSSGLVGMGLMRLRRRNRD
jgi:hypothetical protein